MKATVENINSVQRRVKVTVPAESVDKAFDAVYKRLQKKANFHGFRPGKVPLNIVKKSYGPSIAWEVGEKLINDSLFGAMKEHDVKAIASPVVEAKEAPIAGAQYEFSAVVDIMPAVQVAGYKGLSLTCSEFSVGSGSLDRELKLLARRQARTSDLAADTGAAAGHLAVISHTAQMDGKDLPEMTVNSMPIAVGSGDILAELETGILGMKKGEGKKVRVTLPADYNEADLAGKSVEFDVTLEELRQLELPAMDDEFAKDLSYPSLAALTEEISKRLSERANQLSRQEQEQVVMEALRKLNDFEVPPSMVDQVIDSMISELGIRDEKMQKKALQDSELRKGFRDEAKRRAQNTILLWEVARAEEIQITDGDVKDHIKAFASADASNSDTDIEATFNAWGERAMGVIVSAATVSKVAKEI
jgi:trigger factor